jgi:general secretion pathway protein G
VTSVEVTRAERKVSNAMNKTRRDQPRRGGFSLIELLLVLVILAILATVVVPKFTGRSEQAKEAKAKTDISQLDLALDAFEVDNGRYPSADEGLAALVTPPPSATAWKGPYLKRDVAKDPWEQPYIYRFPGQNNPTSYDLLSTGKDQREGGGDDITNWTQK